MAGRDRLIVDQELCNKVGKLTIRGLEPKEIVDILGISQATVSRIQAANFNLEQFRANNEKRRQAEKQKKEKPTEEENRDPGRAEHQTTQVPGQMEMELPAKRNEEECHAVPYKVLESMIYDNTMKLIQCFCGKNEANKLLLQKHIENLSMKLTTINDNLCQLIRCMRKE